MSIPKICPLLAVGNPVHMAKCREDGCAWWDHLAGSFCIASGADYLRAVSDSLEELTSNSHALGYLQQKGLPSATNTEQAEGGNQGLPDTDSASTIHENGGNVK